MSNPNNQTLGDALEILDQIDAEIKRINWDPETPLPDYIAAMFARVDFSALAELIDAIK
jgi:hypothetical protein